MMTERGMRLCRKCQSRSVSERNWFIIEAEDGGPIIEAQSYESGCKQRARIV
jgi:hypothetical protein